MSNIIKTITIKRNKAPFHIEVGFNTPNDGLDLVDVAYIDFDGRRLGPLDDDIAINILDISTRLNEFMADVMPYVQAEGTDLVASDPEATLSLSNPPAVPSEENRIDELDKILCDLFAAGTNLGSSDKAIADAKSKMQRLITQEAAKLAREAKISVLTELANKKTPRGEDVHPEYTKGFDEMKSKVKFERRRLAALQGGTK